MLRNSTWNARIPKLAGVAAIGAGLIGIVIWYRHVPPSPSTDAPPEDRDEDQGQGTPLMLLDQYLPNAEFAGEVSVAIHAPANAIFAALQTVTVDDMPIANWLGNLRYLPGKLAGKVEARAPAKAKPFIQTLQKEGRNIILAEEAPREVVFGAIGKFHDLLDQQVVPLKNANDFMAFDQPDYQKLAMSFRLTRLDPYDDLLGYRLTLTHRTHALSNEARRKFALYWLGIKPGGNFVSWLMLRAIKQITERAISPMSTLFEESSSQINWRLL
jgi:hypothetical protein